MIYNIGQNEFKNWIVTEENFDVNHLGKCESIMCLGNGYMGVRSAMEENYNSQIRNTFVAGTFNKFDENEVTELPNVADVLAIDIKVDGETLDLTRGTVENYNRSLNLKTGLLTRSFTWTTEKGITLDFTFERIVSMDDFHVIAQKVTIVPQDKAVELKISSGINGQVTNSGAQHFKEGDKRLFEQKYLQALFTTTESNVEFAVHAGHNFTLAGEKVAPKQLISMARRKVYLDFNQTVAAGEAFVIEKISNIFTDRDKENAGLTLEQVKENALTNLKDSMDKGFDALCKASAKAWWEKIWSEKDVKIESDKDFDQLAVRFAIYHIYVMSPIHDNRMNIGAKGLSGEGYKGHTFWDTEVFLLPYFMYSNPQGARSLLEYRYNCIDGARRKAASEGLVGAMYPWESAWITDGEVTPLYGSANVVTGEQTKIWTGLIELHITSDVAFGAWQYYKITNDEDFMNRYGYEILFETAAFWQSRLEWKEEAGRYEITQVIGPDEYKEHIDNNAYTNYMAHWNIVKAMEYYKELKETKKELFDALNAKLGLEATYKEWESKVEKIYLPQINEEMILPQDDTYLTLPSIDLTKYKESDKVGVIEKDYSMSQVSKMQVSKQADVLVLFYLMEHLFEADVKKANFYYYEPRCLHDSSLSLSTHSIIASDLYEKEMAYNLFDRAAQIDLGPVMTTSDAGIHAASFGGVWQCVVNGFAGVRMIDGKLRIAPRLPETWTGIETIIYFQGSKLKLKVTKEAVTVENLTGNAELVTVVGETEYTWSGTLTVATI